MFSQSVTAHLLKSFFTFITGLFKNSIIINLIFHFFDWISKKATESFIYKFLGTDILKEKYYQNSLILRIFTILFEILRKAVTAVAVFLRKISQNSVSQFVLCRAAHCKYFALDVFLALFLGIMFVAPHERWNNLYAFIGALLFAFASLIKIAFAKDKSKNNRMGVLSIFTFIVAILVSTVTAIVFSDAIRIALFMLASLFLAFSVYVSVDTKQKLLRFLKIVLSFVTITALLGIMQRISGVEVDLEFVDVAANEGMPGRVYSTFSNPNNFAELLLLFIPFFVPLFIHTTKGREKFALLIGFLMVFVALLMTYSRSCWVGFALATVLFIVLFDKRLILPGIVVVLLAIPLLPDSIINRIFTIGSMNDTSNSYRLYIWESCLEMIKDFGFTGIGLGPSSFRAVYPGYASGFALTAPHSHMLYMEIIIEMGILGFVGFFSYILTVVKKTAGGMRNMDKTIKAIAISGMSALLGIAFVCCAEYVWFYPRVMFAFFIIPAILMVTVRLSNKD